MKTLLLYIGLIISAPFYLIYQLIAFLEGLPIFTCLTSLLLTITIIWSVYDSRDTLMLSIIGGIMMFFVVSLFFALFSGNSPGKEPV